MCWVAITAQIQAADKPTGGGRREGVTIGPIHWRHRGCLCKWYFLQRTWPSSIWRRCAGIQGARRSAIEEHGPPAGPACSPLDGARCAVIATPTLCCRPCSGNGIGRRCAMCDVRCAFFAFSGPPPLVSRPPVCLGYLHPALVGCHRRGHSRPPRPPCA